MEKQATPRPWAYCEYGNFENESYIEHWHAIVPQGQEPEDKYSELPSFEIARVGVAFWRYGSMNRELPEEVDKANAALIVRAVNNHDALVEALDRLLKEAEMLSAVEGSRWASQELGDAFRQARAALDAARLSDTSENEGQ